VLKPAGVDKSKGVITNYWRKDPADARWADAPDYREWVAFVDKYMTSRDLTDGFAVLGFASAALMTYIMCSSSAVTIYRATISCAKPPASKTM
jgi:branched-chain amino acid transport system substrate-binding protein